MEYDEIMLKDTPGLCRCCLSEGCYKDLATEYTWMNDTEVYADMLLECFDISISQHTEGPNGPNRLICEVCITRLRDACNFKKQVLESEKKFVDLMAKGDFRSKVLIGQPSMKVEAEEVHLEEANSEFLDDDIDFDVDDKDDSADDPSYSGDITIDALPIKNKRGRPRKTATVVKSEKKSNVAKLEEKPRTSKVKDIKCETMSEESAAVRKRRNFVILFNNTTVIPFKWRGKFACFFCGQNYSDHPAFVKHTKSHGHCSVKHTSLKNQKSNGSEVKLDVSFISCEICSEVFHNLDAIIDHLIVTHSFDYDKDVPMYVALYSLADMKCCDCGKSFEFFRHLVTHVNNDHSEKSLLCKSCGKTFNKSRDLAAHIRHYHRKGFNCAKCYLSFDNLTLLRAHSKVKTPKTACSFCEKSFSSFCSKQRHVNNSHCALDEDSKAGLNDMNNEFYEGNIMAAHKQLMQSKATAKKNRINVACVLNMTTAIPFKYYQSRFTCFYCSKDFLEHEEMRQHTMMEHPFCDIDRKFPKVLKGANIYVKLDITSLSCRVCYQPFNDLESIVDHIISMHDAKYDKSITGIMQPFRLEKYNMVCPLCHEAFNYFNILLKHMNQEHSGKDHLCAHCGSKFGNKSILALHISRAHSSNVFKCPECGIEHSSLLKLKSHRAKLHGVRDVICKLCSEKFPSEYEKQKHQIQVHNIGHKCTHCDRMFVKNSFMRNHIRRTHMKEKNVECTVCNEKFFDNFMLRLHMVKHTGARDFHCDVCGKSFFWKKNLRVHMNSHNKKANLAAAM